MAWCARANRRRPPPRRERLHARGVELDTLTHAISGAVLGLALTGTRLAPPKRAATIGLLAAAFPDSDVVLGLFFDPLTYINLHRGITHSLLLLPFWALLIAYLCARWFGNSRALDSHGARGTEFPGESFKWRNAYPLVALALLLHIGFDVLTSFGTQIFAPFSMYKASWPTTFIIDFLFTGLLVVGLIFSVRRRTARPARISLGALAIYVGFQALLLQYAQSVGEAYARKTGLSHGEITALPQPLSPFNWKIVVVHGDDYHIAHVKLFASEPTAPGEHAEGFIRRLLAQYRPVEHADWHRVGRFGSQEHAAWVQSAWGQPGFAPYRRFAQMPVFLAIDQVQGERCAWFSDLRFISGPVNAPIRTPFRYGVCERVDGSWRVYRDGEHGPEPITASL